MKKKLISVIILSLINVTLLSHFYPAIARESIELPRIHGAVQHPQAKQKFVKHKIKIQMPKNNTVSAIKISSPSGLDIGDDITVHTLSGEQIEANTSVSNKIIQIVFLQGYQPGELIEIDLNDVTIKGNSPRWLYRIYVQLIEQNLELSIGVAQIRVYR